VVGLEWYPCCRLQPATRIPLQNIIYIYIYMNEEVKGDLENVLWRETAQFILFTNIT